MAHIIWRRDIIDYLGVSYATVFEDFQVYRLITYGYTQTAIWHLLANALGPCTFMLHLLGFCVGFFLGFVVKKILNQCEVILQVFHKLEKK